VLFRSSNIDKTIVAQGQHQRALSGKLAHYQRLADDARVSLETIMRTLPRDGISLGQRYSEPGTYCSVHVEVSLSQTMRSFDKEERIKELREMSDQAEFMAQELMEIMKQSAFGK